MKQSGFSLVYMLLAVLLVTIGVFFLFNKQTTQTKTPVTQISPQPTPDIFPYQPPEVPQKRAYITFLVGDSMVASLGKNANQLREALIAHYPTHEFVNYNYGFGSTNILSLPDRLNSQTTYLGETFPPVQEQQFDLIVFESFAYNPLSELPTGEGLSKQTEILDKSIREIIQKHPNSVVAIMTPIAPSEEFFAQGSRDLEPEIRKQWVDERISYIKNAIEFAQKNNIPLIDVYEKSLAPDGKVDLKYINEDDYIHPSKEGVTLISKTIADFIIHYQIFPQ